MLWPWYRTIAIDRPIFIIGPFRSGTTILEKIISEHPSVAYFWYLTNVYYKAPVVGFWTTRLLQRLGIIDGDSIPALHNPRIPITLLDPYECEWVWSQSTRNLWDENCTNITAGADFSDPRFERYLFGMIRRHILTNGASRFLNKNPVNCLRMSYLCKLFPDARFITIVRDPIDTIVSHYRTAEHMQRILYSDAKVKRAFQEKIRTDVLLIRIKTRNYARTLELDREHPLLGWANQWIDMQTAVMESIDNEPDLAGQVLQLRYEELVSQPASVLKRMWEFAGLTGEDTETITRTYSNQMSSPPPVELNADESAFLPRVQEIVAPLASQLGYV
ncbi:MAG: sulfotransferase [Fidelibacterota bacterium]|nr:MAG: sulfotransferase [Candidatus Neomarinimicrobiota bacterium]